MTAASTHSWQSALKSIADFTSAHRPDLVVIIGSGLGSAVNCSKVICRISYQDITGFPESSVSGHAGELVISELAGWNVWFFSGRFHCYEGYSAADVVAPVDLSAAAGASRILLTNAAGVINQSFPVFSYMCINDHLNLTGANPLRGVRDNPFVDLSRVYRTDLYAKIMGESGNHGVTLNQGVLASVAGPSYETPAEIRALRILGADAVSMSTVHEAIKARYHGFDVAGLSFMANLAAGCGTAKLDHDDVLYAGNRGSEQLSRLLPEVVCHWQNL